MQRPLLCQHRTLQRLFSQIRVPLRGNVLTSTILVAFTFSLQILRRQDCLQDQKAMSDGLAIAAFIISLATFLFNAIWVPFAKARAESVKLALDLKREYEEKHQEHLDTLYRYEEENGKDKYYLEWLTAMHSSCKEDKAEALEVDKARRRLGLFWYVVKESYEYNALPKGQSWCTRFFFWIPAFWMPDDIMTGNFVRRAIRFRSLVEPLDCANWYYRGNDKKGPAPKGDYHADHKSRPGWYHFIDRQTGKGRDDKQSGKSREELLTEYKDELRTFAAKCKSARDSISPPTP